MEMFQIRKNLKKNIKKNIFKEYMRTDTYNLPSNISEKPKGTNEKENGVKFQ